MLSTPKHRSWGRPPVPKPGIPKYAMRAFLASRKINPKRKFWAGYPCGQPSIKRVSECVWLETQEAPQNGKNVHGFQVTTPICHINDTWLTRLPTKGASQRYAVLARYPLKTRQNACDTPFCDTISEGCGAIWGGILHWVAECRGGPIRRNRYPFAAAAARAG